MIRTLALSVALATASALALHAQERAAEGTGAVLRAIDKITGNTADIELNRGEAATYGHLRIQLGSCRYPVDNPTSDAYALLDIRDANQSRPAFTGWMVASSPALNALDHPRYDVWVLRCKRS